MATMRQLLESLTTTGVSGAIPKEIRASLFEENRKNNPLYGALPRFPTETNQYYWVKRNQLPAGGMSLEAPPFTGAGSVTAASSNYANTNSTIIRNITFKGDVGLIAEQVATRVGSVIQNEIKGQVENESRLETVMNLYGSQAATFNSNKIQWDGFNRLINSANALKYGGSGSSSPVAQTHLDNLFDQVRTNTGTQNLGGMWAYLVSPKMETAINALFTQTMRTDMPLDSGTVSAQIDPDVFGQKDQQFYRTFVRMMAGLNVRTYRGCPILTSDFLTPTGQMGTLTLGDGGANSTTFNGSTTVYYRMEGVTLLGRTIASAEASNTPANGHGVSISWSTPNITDAFGNAYPVLNYRLYRATSSGAETLYAIISAYDSSDNPVTSVTDNNVVLNPFTGSSGYMYTVASAGNSDGVNVPATASTVEDIYLIPLDPDICGMAVLNETRTMQLAPILSRSVQFETTSDMALALFSGAFVAQATGLTHP